jgi:hypothetical protein
MMGIPPAMMPPGAGGGMPPRPGLPVPNAMPRPPQGPAAPPIAGGGKDKMEMLLAFMAGAGFREVVGNLTKLRKPPGDGKHPSALKAEAAKNPAMSPPPGAMPGMPPAPASPGAAPGGSGGLEALWPMIMKLAMMQRQGGGR